MIAAESQVDVQETSEAPAFPWKLWIYTNYDCNLRCRYCVAKSSPNAPRRAIGLGNVQRLVDESTQLGFVHAFFTGGEPFLLPDIHEMLAYSAARIQTTVLTNAMLLHGTRLEKLAAIANDRLIVQVSLDGGRPEDHDAYRGAGSWARAVDGIRRLQAHGFRVRLGTTETPVNSSNLRQLCEFHRSSMAIDTASARSLTQPEIGSRGADVDPFPVTWVDFSGVFTHLRASDSLPYCAMAASPGGTAGTGRCASPR